MGLNISVPDREGVSLPWFQKVESRALVPEGQLGNLFVLVLKPC